MLIAKLKCSLNFTGKISSAVWTHIYNTGIMQSHQPHNTEKGINQPRRAAS